MVVSPSTRASTIPAFLPSKIPDKHLIDSITSYATRDIAPDEEITFCYDSSFGCRARSERHKLLRFECTCKACVLGTEFQMLTDMRRMLGEGLCYLTTGRDLDGRQHVAGATILVDARLKRTAETASIPLSSRLVCNFLTMALAEQEGKLHEFLVERMSPGISILPPLFDTENNKKIARLGMAQMTWTQKFCTPLALWGKADAGDDAAIEAYRKGYELKIVLTRGIKVHEKAVRIHRVQ
jgi:hypothetical protein